MADHAVYPTRQLQCRAIVTADGASCTATQLVARRVRSPSDDQRRKCHWRAVPTPWIAGTSGPGFHSVAAAVGSVRDGKLPPGVVDQGHPWRPLGAHDLHLLSPGS